MVFIDMMSADSEYHIVR